METDIIRQQHFGTQAIYGHTVDGDHTCLDKIICLTTAADTGVSEVLVQTNRLGRIFVLLTIDLLFVCGIKTVVTFRFTSERFMRAFGTLCTKTERLRFTLTVFAAETRTSTYRLSFSAETRTRSAFSIVGIVVKHVFKLLTLNFKLLTFSIGNSRELRTCVTHA